MTSRPPPSPSDPLDFVVERLAELHERSLSETARRKSGAHYTPKSLCAPIVKTALAPLIGERPRSEEILALKILDPAMGTGAFLIEACRQLAEALAEARRREGIAETEDPITRARRDVAASCLYGVDKNAFAATLARLSLWLFTSSPEEPLTFLERALFAGDALVGFDLDELRAFHWRPERGADLGDLPPERARLYANALAGAFFAHDGERARERERLRRLAIVKRDLAGDPHARAELERLAGDPAPLCFPIELPGVRFDAVIGNPPFAGKNAIRELGGPRYVDWLKTLHPNAHGNADYAAHFFRRADTLLADRGTISFIATNTIAQGDTRDTGLRYLVERGYTIYAATKSTEWPARGASVSVSIVHLARGLSIAERVLDGARVETIDSRLSPRAERGDPRPLAENAGLAFQGSTVLGMGFTLAREERDALVERSPKNAERIFPYLGGEEINTDPRQGFARFVIGFGELSLEEAAAYPDLLDIVRERVKPERDRATHSTAEWWRFERPRPDLYAAIAPLSRCLVASRVSKHLMFAWQPTDRVFAESLCAFACDRATFFAILQSRIHEAWAWTHSSTLEGRLRYTPSECFETFPFPTQDPREPIAELEELGEALHETRARWLREQGRGLTQLYNQLKDPACSDPRIAELRALHEAIDRAVLAAYGWSDPTPGELLDRLFALNAARGLTTPSARAKPARSSSRRA